ncbi:MAG: hypothetical protein MUC87_09030 [Bacteroidia bacterium]|nr:hypothetical protein [Bacteroidia bacterium]
MKQPAIPTHLYSCKGVAGIGFGLKETAGLLTTQPAWRVYVHKKIPVAELPLCAVIPENANGFPTDVIEISASVACHAKMPLPGMCIANSKGVPGTLGAYAWKKDTQEPVMLSNYHVLFGLGAAEGDTIWKVNTTESERQFSIAGKAELGRIGNIRHSGVNYYVDCAIASCHETPVIKTAHQPLTHSEAQPGETVYKYGASTGLTQGIVADASYPDIAAVESHSFDAQNQLLIRSNSSAPFSGSGDSGSIVLNAKKQAVGLLWGTNMRGEGIACPIAPVMFSMHISFEKPSAEGFLKKLLNRFTQKSD